MVRLYQHGVGGRCLGWSSGGPHGLPLPTGVLREGQDKPFMGADQHPMQAGLHLNRIHGHKTTHLLHSPLKRKHPYIGMFLDGFFVLPVWWMYTGVSLVWAVSPVFQDMIQGGQNPCYQEEDPDEEWEEGDVDKEVLIGVQVCCTHLV
ncbi:MAG: hypothetical protein COV59_02550 [Candidatus Magasanikbacteria bacterium CG11_big_fil_rev_8_21_14_0_20_39_34]|uniref:Uncharacterized protein n=1 Tax=Candidatus Magasanikbacteria bacterium CG11_big_fil_rev_8_21_14_0_20_39_34 TaxID=1974653 RepID=A0A2H0N571_9BACT|nr:MAG: hypothetical protein COV59_02550 [Candidatus Magasanikbacteria bacterium CG11_big_fil_rev_8_21_14_0_20_39_34]